MKLAVNYSDEAALLLAQGRVRVDLLKSTEWPDMLAASQALCATYVHFDLRAGDGRLREADWPGVRDLLARTASRHVGVHLCPMPAHFPGRAPDDPTLQEDVLERLIGEVSLAVERFGAAGVLVENMPYWGGADPYVVRPAVTPAVIRRVVEATGCGLLLDIAHARIAATTLGWDVRAYIASLPVDRLGEIHISGVRDVNGRTMDHMPLTDEDWDLTQWALDRIRGGDWAEPYVAAFEYGGTGKPFKWRSDSAVIESHLLRLAEMVASA